MQKDKVITYGDKVIAYEYRKLKDHEQKYSSYELELTTVIDTLNIW